MTRPETSPLPAAERAAGAGLFDRWMTRVALTTGGAVLTVMTLLCVVNVLIMRKLLAAPIVGAEDALILFLVTFVALSIPFGARSGAHIEIEIVSEMLPRRLALGMQIAARLFGSAFLWLMAWQLAKAGSHAARFGEVTQQLEISYEPFYYLLAVCFGLFAAIQFADACQMIRTGQAAALSLEDGA
ncbi:TRAP transporter small permease [Celeribacter sp.]|uniref:TRAP transporter small permease n=1 Tax=Celeribacter sp. TaxID=1890673 RepID=UPI003A9380F2